MKQDEVTYSDKYNVDTSSAPVTHDEANIKAGQASMITGDYSGDTYDQVYSEYMATGESDSLSDAKAKVENEVQPQVVSDLINKSSTPDFAAEAINKYMSQPDVPTAVVAKEATAKNQNASEFFNEQVAYEQAKYSLRKALASEVDSMNASEKVGALAEIAFIPFLEQAKANGLEPKDFKGSIFHGTNLALLSEDFSKIPDKDKPEYIQSLKEKIKDSAVGNAYADLFTVNAIVDGQKNWEKWLNNATTVLDTIGLGFMVKGLTKMVRTAKGLINPTVEEAPVSLLSQNNPELSQALATAGIESEDVANIVSGASSKEIFAETHMPNSSLDETSVKGMSSGLSKAERERRQVQESIYDEASGTGIRLTEEQRAAKIERNKEQADDVAVLYGDMKVEVHATDDGEHMAMKIPMARNTEDGTVPFSSPIEAINVSVKAGEKFGVTPEDVQLLKRDMVSKEFVPVSKEELSNLLVDNQKGEYTTVINTIQRFDSKGTVSPDDMVKFSKLQKMLTINGKNYSNFFLDPANMFSKWITGTIGVAADKTTVTQKKLVDMIDRDFADLGTPSKRKVWDAIEKGNDGQRYFSERELLQGRSTDGKYTFKPLNSKEVNAAYSIYRFWDTVWQLDNRTFNRKLIDGNYYRLSANDGKDVMFAKPTTIDSVDTKIYNPESGEVISKSDAAGLIKNENLEVYKLKYPKNDAKFVLRTAKTSGRRVRENDVSLNKIDGYVKRNYKADYFVEKVNLSTNKVSVVAAGTRLGDAQSFIARQAEDTENIYRWRRAKEQSQVDEVRAKFEKGRSVERSRGKRLTSIVDLDSKIGKADIENPIESMINAAASTSNAAVMFDAIKTMKGNFLKNYSIDKFPETVEQINHVYVKGIDKTAEAKALFTYLHNMERVGSNNITSNMFRDVLFNMSELIEEGGVLGKLSGVTGEALRAVAKVDPIRAARTLPHVLFIAAAPIRQFIVQHSQLIQLLPLTKRYANPINLMKDMHIMRSLYATKDDISKFDKIISKEAKWLGLSETELRRLFKAFNESGLAESVHSNTMIERTFAMAGKDIYNSKVKHVVAKAGKVATLIPNYGQKYGFDIGEFNNLLGTFLVAYERKRGAIDLANKTDRASLADDTRKLSWNMNSAGKFGYQYGMLSIPMQFIQVPHKAMLNMLVGSGALTKQERMRVAAMNMTLFGAAGFGIDALLDPMKDELSPEVYSAVNDGILNQVLNVFGDFITGGDGSNVDFVTSLSPITSVQDIMGKPVEALFEGKVELGGAFFGAANRLFTTAQTTKDLFLLSNLDDKTYTPVEQLSYILRNLATVYSGANHFETFLLQQKTKRLMSLSGTDAGDATGLEIVAKLAGMRTIKETEMFDIMNDTRKLRKSYEDSMRKSIKISSKASLALTELAATGQEAPEDLLVQLRLPADMTKLYSEADVAYGNKYFYQEWKRLNTDFEQDLSRNVHYAITRVPGEDLENGSLANRYRKLLQTNNLTETETQALTEMLGYLEGDK